MGANCPDRHRFLPATSEDARLCLEGWKGPRALTRGGRWEMVVRAIGRPLSLSEGTDGFGQNEAAYRYVTSFDWLWRLKRKKMEDRR